MAELEVSPDEDAGGQSCDGWVEVVDFGGQTFDDLRDQPEGTFETTDDIDYFGALFTQTDDLYRSIVRIILTFDTSPLGAGSTVTGAVLSLRGESKANDLGLPDMKLHIAGAHPAAFNALEASDYSSVERTSFGEIAYDDWATSSYNDITLNSNGLAAIDTDGITVFSTQLSDDLDGGFTGFYQELAGSYFEGYMAEGGPSFKPKLTITYDEGEPALRGTVGVFDPGQRIEAWF